MTQQKPDQRHILVANAFGGASAANSPPVGGGGRTCEQRRRETDGGDNATQKYNHIAAVRMEQSMNGGSTGRAGQGKGSGLSWQAITKKNLGKVNRTGRKLRRPETLRIEQAESKYVRRGGLKRTSLKDRNSQGL